MKYAFNENNRHVHQVEIFTNESGRFFTNLDKEAKRNEETYETWKE